MEDYFMMFLFISTLKGGAFSYKVRWTTIHWDGVQLLCRFVWFYGHRLISVPPHRSLGPHRAWGRSGPPL